MSELLTSCWSLSCEALRLCWLCLQDEFSSLLDRPLIFAILLYILHTHSTISYRVINSIALELLTRSLIKSSTEFYMFCTPLLLNLKIQSAIFSTNWDFILRFSSLDDYIESLSYSILRANYLSSRVLFWSRCFKSSFSLDKY